MLETTLNPAVDGFFLILATASVSPDSADYTAHFTARIDTGDDIADRYIKINDTIDRNLTIGFKEEGGISCPHGFAIQDRGVEPVFRSNG
jgi:hypothetical protein